VLCCALIRNARGSSLAFELRTERPDYFRDLTAKGDQAVRDFALGIAVSASRSRQSLDSRGILDRKTKVAVLCGHDINFSHQWFERELRPAGILGDQISFFKGTSTGSYGDATTVQNRFLDVVNQMSRGTDRGVVWVTTHGLSEGLCASSSRAITPRELAQSLLSGRAHGSQVNLGHLTLIMDACHQYDFTVNLHREIATYARANDLRVTALPPIVTPAQRGTVGYTSIEKRHALTTALTDRVTSSGLTFADVGRVDTAQKTYVDSARDHWSMLAEQFSGTRYRLSWDPAVFGGEVLTPAQLIERARGEMRHLGIDSIAPRIPERDERSTPFELGSKPRSRRRDDVGNASATVAA
jgi:hypothetical protein